jgi:peptide/nickel transport system permease protein
MATDGGELARIADPPAPPEARLILRRRSVWHRLRTDRASQIGFAIVFLAVFGAVFADFLAPADPTAQDLLLRRQPPSTESLLGLLGRDELGRDILSRLLFGARATLGAGAFAVVLATLIGVPVGLVAAYFGGKLEGLVMRIVDGMLAFPSFLLAVVVVAILGPSLANAALAVGVSSIPAYVRLVRGSVLSQKQEQYVLAAVAAGAGPRIVMFRHILPNVAAPIIVLASLSTATAILSIAGLSFLGLGAQPPTPEWGVMLGNGKSFIRLAPHMTIVPGLAIMLVVLGFNLIGDAMRDALDSRLVNA